MKDSKLPTGHFIINPEVEMKLEDQRKDGPTGFESWNRSKWPYLSQSRKNKKMSYRTQNP
jgi:hypothetical protein